MNCAQIAILAHEFHRIYDEQLGEVARGAPKGCRSEMFEHVPAAVCQFYSVSALGPAVGQNVDRAKTARCLRAEEICCQSFSLISVIGSYDQLYVLHDSSFLACLPACRIQRAEKAEYPSGFFLSLRYGIECYSSICFPAGPALLKALQNGAGQFVQCGDAKPLF